MIKGLKITTDESLRLIKIEKNVEGLLRERNAIAVHQIQERKTRFGELVQIIGPLIAWFERIKPHIHRWMRLCNPTVKLVRDVVC